MAVTIRPEVGHMAAERWISGGRGTNGYVKAAVRGVER